MPIWICEHAICENTYKRYPSEIKKGIKKYCSQVCASLSRKPETRYKFPGIIETRICSRYYCYNTFNVRPTSTKKRCGNCPNSYITAQGYVMLTRMTGHPLANGTELLEHRKVLFDSVGDGPQLCHWCNRTVYWSGSPYLHTDHIDFDRTNNDPENLVPSCSGCNTHR